MTWHCPVFESACSIKYCPPEGCPKGFCARLDAKWEPGDPSPPECKGERVATIEHHDRPVLGTGKGDLDGKTKAIQVSDKDEISLGVGGFMLTLSKADLTTFDNHRAEVNRFRRNLGKEPI